MPKVMPPLASAFASQVNPTLEIADVAERLRNNALIGQGVRTELTLPRTYLVYELAYLRLFSLWEQFLEEVMIRNICGCTFQGYAEQVQNGVARTIAEGKVRLFNNRHYVLLHNPTTILGHINRLFVHSQVTPSRRRGVIVSFQQRLQDFANIRHRIAYNHRDARQRFDATCMGLVGRRFRGGRPGVLLREPTVFDKSNTRWLRRAGRELQNIATQLAP